MNSIFYEELKEFLPLRERILAPHTFASERRALLSFEKHLVQLGKIEKIITEEDVISWIQAATCNDSQSGVYHKIGALRMFLKNLQFRGFPVYIPPRPKISKDYMPYLFSDEELVRLFHAADNFSSLQTIRDDPRYRMEMPMLLRMLYSCGFRLGELLEAKIHDIDFVRETILLRNTKNKKQRIVPMGSTLTNMLNRYCLALDLLDDPCNYIFPAKDRQHPLPHSTTRLWFNELLKETGIYVEREAHCRGQCVHCFRHLFAVKSFMKAEQAGRPVHDSVPFLSMYLGHGSMEETERYLKFSNDMFPEHTKMFEEYSDGLFPEVSYED